MGKIVKDRLLWCEPHIGTVLEELLSVESPRRISLGILASGGRELTLEQGKRVIVKVWQMTKYYEQTTVSILLSPVLLRRREKMDVERSCF